MTLSYLVFWTQHISASWAAPAPPSLCEGCTSAEDGVTPLRPLRQMPLKSGVFLPLFSPTTHPLSKRAGALRPAPSRPSPTPNMPVRSTSFHQLGDQLFTTEGSSAGVKMTTTPGTRRKNGTIPKSIAPKSIPGCSVLLWHKLVLLPSLQQYFLSRQDNCCNERSGTHDGTIFSAIGDCTRNPGQICSYLIKAVRTLN